MQAPAVQAPRPHGGVILEFLDLLDRGTPGRLEGIFWWYDPLNVLLALSSPLFQLFDALFALLAFRRPHGPLAHLWPFDSS